MTINGIGVRLLGASNLDHEGCYRAYYWFTFIYAPIFPFAKWKLKREFSKEEPDIIHQIERLPMRLSEVLLIYLKGYFFYPIVIFWPIPFIVSEVYSALNLPESLYNYAIGFGITYFIVMVLYFSNQYAKQGLPKNYERLMKEKEKNLDQ